MNGTKFGLDERLVFVTRVAGALGPSARALFRAANLAPENPLASLIHPGDVVLLKPNWVYHRNESGAGLESLITSPDLLQVMLADLALARPQKIILGDAPIQGCNLPQLWGAASLQEGLRRCRQAGIDTQLKDFRRTILTPGLLRGSRREAVAPEDDFILFDLREQSLLEKLTGPRPRFRVTMYNPDLMARRHAPGKHQYLVARAAMEATVILNLPKIKTHKKVGLTGAIKNFIGINGNKEFLPHHRRGGSARGGDCYCGGSLFKACLEAGLDFANRRRHHWSRSLGLRLNWQLQALAAKLGMDPNVEGSWYGNDTAWRTCLDLLRIAVYGKTDGTLAATPQRRILSLGDAAPAGQGEGPLTPTPTPFLFLILGSNPAAVDWVNALLMGFNPERLPSIREAFTAHPLPLTSFAPEAIAVVDETGRRLACADLPRFYPQAATPPRGWVGHCELAHFPYPRTGC